MIMPWQKPSMDYLKQKSFDCGGLWRGVEDAEYATLEWVDGFNHRPLLEPIRNLPPAELEMNFYRQLNGRAMVA